jgi:iron-sulfur cluster assembly protein
VIAEHHQPLLEDTVLDFVQLDSGEFKFIFINQQPSTSNGGGCASSGCGGGSCGTGGGCGSRGNTH